MAPRYYDTVEELIEAIRACEALDLDYTITRGTESIKTIIGSTESLTYKLKIKGEEVNAKEIVGTEERGEAGTSWPGDYT